MSHDRDLPLGLVLTVGVIGVVIGLGAAGGRKLVAQALTTGGHGDWLEALKAEHKLVAAQFELLEQTTEAEAGKRAAILEHIAYGLSKHGIEEENIVYPALREADQEAAAKSLYADHADIKSFIYELRELPKDDPRWLPRLRAFHEVVKAHVREEEEEIYPAFRAKMTPEQNAHLGRLMHAEGVKVA